MAVLDFADPQADYAALEEDLQGIPLVSERPLREIRRRRAMLQYWQRDYADLVDVARTANDAEDADAIDPESSGISVTSTTIIVTSTPG